MKLKVVRKIFTDKSTIGDLLVNDKFECFTLEDKVREIQGKKVNEWKVPNVTAIPYGLYKLVLDYSTRFKKTMPHVLNVPGFDGIRIHSGNKSENTEGCLLVGTSKKVDYVGNSKDAFAKVLAKLYLAIKNKEEITIEYTNENVIKMPLIEIRS